MNEDELNIVNTITSSLDSIDSHVINIDEKLDEIIVIQSPEKEEKKDEQKDEKTIEEKTTKSGEQEEQITEEITISDVYTEIQTTNTLLERQNNILEFGIFSLGIMIGILVLALFWQRVVR